MSDKRLLNENTIRRMMQMANIESLSEDFLGDLTSSEEVIQESQEVHHPCLDSHK